MHDFSCNWHSFVQVSRYKGTLSDGEGSCEGLEDGRLSGRLGEGRRAPEWPRCHHIRSPQGPERHERR